MSYATNTEVSVEKTRAEIEKALSRAGAQRMAFSLEPGTAMIGFQMRGRFVRFMLPLPDRADKAFSMTPSRKFRRTTEETFKAWEQACRSRWRALYLCIKAKLEAVDAGITSFEEEFLAHIVIPGGGTFGDAYIPQIDAIYETGVAPKLLEM